MIKVYAITLAIGVAALIFLIFDTAVSANREPEASDGSERFGATAKMALGAALGFAMAGMAAEYSPLDLSWQVALIIAIGGLVVGGAWARYAVAQAED